MVIFGGIFTSVKLKLITALKGLKDICSGAAWQVMSEVSSVLVTGGAGFIGLHLVKRLLSLGVDVIVFDVLENSARRKMLESIAKDDLSGKLTVVRGDVLAGEKQLSKALASAEAVVHLAALVDVSASMKAPEAVDRVNALGTLLVLKACVDAGTKRFVYASSCAVYGEAQYLPIDEEHPLNPLSSYGVSKLVGERYCQIFQDIYGVEAVVLRLFNVYGPGQGVGGYANVISSFVERMVRDEPVVIYGDGLQTRDFVYVDDVVEALVRVLSSDRAIGEVLNVGTGVRTAIEDLARAIGKLLGKEEVRALHAPPRPGEIRHSQANIEKALRLIGYKPAYTLERGLPQTVSWLVNQVKELSHD